jgi:hypothetical protein
MIFGLGFSKMLLIIDVYNETEIFKNQNVIFQHKG